VFNFFVNSFPNIQFVISTHSPFVVQSVSDAIIYNLSNNEQMEDLSIYSYSSIVKGLLGEATNSDDLESLLAEVGTLSKNNDFGNRFDEVMEILESKVNVLDPRAKAIYLGARSRMVDWREGEENV
ncbi:TPA: recombination protein RecF, partial [Klebsiella pneumoniae]|nr:recombination protein RecF [Klebsiella pneumoniae]